MKTKSGLENEYGQSVSLNSIHIDGKLEGLLLTMLVKQRYLNDSDETIEASYTFPAGSQVLRNHPGGKHQPLKNAHYCPGLRS